MYGKEITTYTFSYEDADGNLVNITKSFDEADEMLTWPKIIYGIAGAVGTAFGYDVIDSISIKGQPLRELAMNDFMPSRAEFKGEHLELFPETSSCMAD